MWNITENQIELILIRHGQTVGNEEKRYIGRTDESLSENGKAGLEKIEAPEIDCLYISPMKRCIETAQILYPDMTYTIAEDLREVDFGSFEGKNYLELSGDDDYQRWIDSNGTLSFPKGESRVDFVVRTLRGITEILNEEIKNDANKIGIIAHGGTIMSVLSALYGGEYFDYQMSNSEGCRCLVSRNEDGYHIDEWERLGWNTTS